MLQRENIKDGPRFNLKLPGFYYRVCFYSDTYRDFIGNSTEFVYQGPLEFRLQLFQQTLETQYEQQLA